MPIAQLKTKMLQAGFSLPVRAGLLLIAVTTLVHARWTDRWNLDLDETKRLSQRLSKVPMQFGEWTGEALEGLDKSTMEVAGAQGCISRVYRNPQGESVSVFILCGRPRDMMSHSPDKCYPAAGFETLTQPSSESIDTADGNAGFVTSTFMSSNERGTPCQRVYWSYGSKGKWDVPSDVKWAFGSAGIFKIYISMPTAPRETHSPTNSASEFVRAAIPDIDRALFTSKDAPAANP